MTEELTPPSDAQVEAKQKAFWERARKGVLKHLQEKDGKLSLAELHDYSMNKFFVQHQGFSRMMEFFVHEQLVDYDYAKSVATLTEKGRKFLAE